MWKETEDSNVSMNMKGRTIIFRSNNLVGSYKNEPMMMEGHPFLNVDFWEVPGSPTLANSDHSLSSSSAIPSSRFFPSD